MTLNDSGSHYGKSFQHQLLAHLRWEKDLLQDAIRVMTVEDLELPIARVIYEALKNYFNRYRKLPTEQELDDELYAVIKNIHGNASSAVNPEEYEALVELRAYIHSMGDPKVRNIDRFRSELGRYLVWSRTVKEIDSSLPAYYQGGDLGMPYRATEIEREVVSKLESQATQHVYSTNTGIMMTPEEAEFRVSTGTSNLDSYLDGGLGLGELGMITASPGLGKTNTLINFGVGANFVRQHALLVSLELQEKIIKRRYTAMAGCIPGKIVKSIYMLWPEEQKKRYQMLLNEDFAAHDLFTVSDKAGKHVTVDMIETEIELWRDSVAHRCGKEEVQNCTCVLVDWGDLLHLVNESPRTAEHERLKTILNLLKQIAVRQQVALWTASQGTKEADGRPVLQMSHVSYGYHKNDALDVGIGLGLTDAEMSRQREHYESEGRCAEITDSGRTMNFNINKNRNAPIGLARLYQAPTLRFYNETRDYQHHNKLLASSQTPDEVWQAAQREQ